MSLLLIHYLYLFWVLIFHSNTAERKINHNPYLSRFHILCLDIVLNIMPDTYMF